MIDYKSQNSPHMLKNGNRHTAYEKNALHRAAAHQNRGEYAKAGAIYKEILRFDPQNTSALFDFGMLSQKLDSPEHALLFFTKTLEIDKEHVSAYVERGHLLRKSNRFEEAFNDYSLALKIDPYSFEALVGRGLLFGHISQFENAIKDFDRAIELKPNSSDTLYNRALAHTKLGKVKLSINDYSSAINFNPNHYQAYNNRGLAYREMKAFKKAIQDFNQSVTIKPEFACGFWNKALTHMMIGDYKTAWQLYEYRWKSPSFTSPERNFTKPIWLGKESINKKTILLHSEQGLGDSLQFCRYINKFHGVGCTVLLEIERPLMQIMTCLLPKEQIFQKGTKLPDFDFHCPLGSLPLAFDTTIDTVPYPFAYLQPAPERTQWWRDYLGERKKPRVGLAWQGNPAHPKDYKRSIRLDTIIHKLSPKFDWYSLHLNISHEDQKLFDQNAHLTHFGNLVGDFAETAAMCTNLDMVISVDTSIAHLGGAVGCPVHLLLSETADARWHYFGSSSPWYDSVTLHRKSLHREWSHLIDAALKSL